MISLMFVQVLGLVAQISIKTLLIDAYHRILLCLITRRLPGHNYMQH